MSKLGLIIKREYLQRVSKKSFLLLTFLAPVLFAAMVFVPLWLATLKSDEMKNIVVLDQVGKYASAFKNTDEYRFLPAEGDMEEYRKSEDKEIEAFLAISDDLLTHPEAATLYSKKQIPMGLKREVNNQLSAMLEQEKLDSYQIPDLKQIIDDCKVSFDIQTVKWEDDGSESSSSAEVMTAIGFVSTFVIYMFILMYGSMVMQGVMEEKTNRIVELMVSSVKPFDLMMGKIVGIGMVGLTQVFLWGILTVVLVSGSLFFFGGDATQTADLMMSSNMNQAAMMTSTDPTVLKIQDIIHSIPIATLGINFLLYFIGGYILYASLFAAIGSAINQPEDANQFMTPMMIFILFGFYAGIYSVENPDGPLAFWCSLIPFTSPIVMMVRLPYDIPLWEHILSLVLLFVAAYGCVWISGKIYRTGILMYGKKPSIAELIRWIKYKA